MREERSNDKLFSIQPKRYVVLTPRTPDAILGARNTKINVTGSL